MRKVGKLALAEFDITVKPGELVVVLGGNGSGKTTLMRCVTRTLQPTDGSVAINGVDCTSSAGTVIAPAANGVSQIATASATPSKVPRTRPSSATPIVASAACA